VNRELASANVVVTQSLTAQRCTLGPGNALMARVAKELHQRYDLPVIPRKSL